MERECLRILLRGSQPIIICPARSLPQRIPAEWRQPLADGRLLLLSGFRAGENRITAELATRRNEFVAALADEVCFAHITPGGQAERLTHLLTNWRVPFSTLDRSLITPPQTAVTSRPFRIVTERQIGSRTSTHRGERVDG